MEKKLGIGFPWRAMSDEHAAGVFAALQAEQPTAYAGWQLDSARSVQTAFYSSHAIVELRLARDGAHRVRYLLSGPRGPVPLGGSSAPIHAANEAESLTLTEAAVLDYVRFFVFFLHGSEGPFTLLEAALELELRDPAADSGHLERLRSHVKPLRIGAHDGHGRFLVPASIAYDGTLWRTTLAVAPDGQVEMIDEKDPQPLHDVDAPRCPYVDDTASAAATPSASAPDVETAGSDTGEAQVPAADAGAAVAPVARGAVALDETVSDREITRTVVSVLLADAVRERIGTTLLKRFNSQTQADEPIPHLARFVSGSHPVIIIESDIPFIEDIVAGLIEPDLGQKGKPHLGRARAMSGGDDLRCYLELAGISPGDFYLISFHAYRSLWDAERVAHELASHSSTVLIGCDRLADVPESLRRVADLVLSLPRIDRRLFPRIFTRVFGVGPPANWDRGSDWTRYLIAADFHAPRRLKLTASQAVAYLRERVQARLRQVSVADAQSLASLHGLGEARQVAEDLITDIRSAQSGRIAWSAVDRGLLLVGPPGVGKTTLARAIAHDCGVRFVLSSAAQWQSAGALDAHLRAMRNDFNEARRYAPSILFIAELDSFGSRERPSGPNAQYQTEVINALLEQLQGSHVNEPVIVIGATNHADDVDPALRRAGRLDQVVTIPLPNVASLERMFADYLAPYRKEQNVDGDVRERVLAELAFGLTGADVEFFVRGAARRARKRGRMIRQEDLIAEVTRRPRGTRETRCRPLEEMRRTAVHESGHAIAQLTNTAADNEVALVTIIPRTDGSLGFVATLPPEGVGLTRASAIERLETVLAGRAAEELVYGADNVGLSAGGPNSSSDLAIANRIATLLVCESGLADDDGGLHWTESPTPAQSRQIDALLRRAYRSSLARLRAHRALLDRLCAALMQDQELDRRKLRALLNSNLLAGSPAQPVRAPAGRRTAAKRAKKTRRTTAPAPASRSARGGPRPRARE